jgi:hypothetical protein
MSGEPSLELHKAVRDALRGSAALTTLIDTRVYDQPPEKPVFPYVSIGEDEIVDASTTCDVAFEAYVTVHCWSRARGKPELKRCAAAVYDALNVPLAMTAWTVSEVIFDHTRHQRDPDGVTEHSIVTFRYLIDPA